MDRLFELVLVAASWWNSEI